MHARAGSAPSKRSLAPDRAIIRGKGHQLSFKEGVVAPYRRSKLNALERAYRPEIL
jgi:hypothetical protein